MPIQGSREGNGGKRRAVLLLSLILLVWNAGATALHLASDGIPPSIGGTGRSPDLPSATDDEAATRSPESPRSGPLTIRQKYLLGKRIDINNASIGEVSELPGVSDEIAAAILEERDRLGRFRSPEDLLGVKGIKEKRLQKILPFLKKMPNN
ncbi:MAG: helix-hairpin-helix domain-containing protein [Deltaproteobacteria bacterium]|nr:helix-hairpin-helix domain-containing protein [Candidatus Deferrimicrobium borealis]